uniref:HD domain-containing protein n=2 Tax=Rhabditophanes sp. KR3021 TaxID=114890 RepID=A0AC35U9P4_9BILA
MKPKERHITQEVLQTDKEIGSQKDDKRKNHEMWNETSRAQNDHEITLQNYEECEGLSDGSSNTQNNDDCEGDEESNVTAMLQKNIKRENDEESNGSSQTLCSHDEFMENEDGDTSSECSSVDSVVDYDPVVNDWTIFELNIDPNNYEFQLCEYISKIKMAVKMIGFGQYEDAFLHLIEAFRDPLVHKYVVDFNNFRIPPSTNKTQFRMLEKAFYTICINLAKLVQNPTFFYVQALTIKQDEQLFYKCGKAAIEECQFRIAIEMLMRCKESKQVKQGLALAYYFVGKYDFCILAIKKLLEENGTNSVAVILMKKISEKKIAWLDELLKDVKNIEGNSNKNLFDQALNMFNEMAKKLKEKKTARSDNNAIEINVTDQFSLKDYIGKLLHVFELYQNVPESRFYVTIKSVNEEAIKTTKSEAKASNPNNIIKTKPQPKRKTAYGVLYKQFHNEVKHWMCLDNIQNIKSMSIKYGQFFQHNGIQAEPQNTPVKSTRQNNAIDFNISGYLKKAALRFSIYKNDNLTAISRNLLCCLSIQRDISFTSNTIILLKKLYDQQLAIIDITESPSLDMLTIHTMFAELGHEEAYHICFKLVHEAEFNSQEAKQSLRYSIDYFKELAIRFAWVYFQKTRASYSNYVQLARFFLKLPKIYNGQDIWTFNSKLQYITKDIFYTRVNKIMNRFIENNAVFMYYDQQWEVFIERVSTNIVWSRKDEKKKIALLHMLFNAFIKLSNFKSAIQVFMILVETVAASSNISDYVKLVLYVLKRLNKLKVAEFKTLLAKEMIQDLGLSLIELMKSDLFYCNLNLWMLCVKVSKLLALPILTEEDAIKVFEDIQDYSKQSNLPSRSLMLFTYGKMLFNQIIYLEYIMADLLLKTQQFVKETLKDAEGGHDWFHIKRVHDNAVKIAQTEECNLLVVQLGALLHDIADSKFHGGDESVGPRIAAAFLEKEGVSEDVINHVVNIINNISYKGGNFKKTFTSKELDVVQDADRLDALGAIGIARTFNYGGFKNKKLYDPEILPNTNMTKEEYKKSDSPTLNHFHEKLLLLKDLMNTPTGKQLAQKRHHYMEQFLEQFHEEWNAEKNENKEGKDLLKKWYSEYSPNSEEMSVADRPPGHGLGDVNVATGVGAGYGVGSVSYRQDFGFGMGLSGRSGGQRYGFGSDLMPHLNG